MSVKKKRKVIKKRKGVVRKSKGKQKTKSKKRVAPKKLSKKTVKKPTKNRKRSKKKPKKRTIKKVRLSVKKRKPPAERRAVKIEVISDSESSSSSHEMETESSSTSSIGTQTVPSTAPTNMLTDTSMASDDRFEKYNPPLMLLDGVPPQMTQNGTVEENMYQPQLALTDKQRPMKLADAYRPKYAYPNVSHRERVHPIRPSRMSDYPSVKSKEKLAKSPSPPRGRTQTSYPSINRATSKEKVRAVSPPKNYTVFKATERWKEVKKGMAVPKGLEYKFDKDTGKNYARWPKKPKPVKEKKAPTPKPKPKPRPKSRSPSVPKAKPKSKATSPPKEKKYTIFHATYEFQEVLPGHACPPGLEYKMDMATGRSYARKMRK